MNRELRLPLSALLLAALLLLAGCGGTPSDDSTSSGNTRTSRNGGGPSAPVERTSSAGLKGWELLTADDVEGVFGVPVKRGKRSEPNCAWDSTEELGGMTIDVVEALPMQMAGAGKDSIEGIGDGAYFMNQSSQMAILNLWKGDHGLVLSVMFPMSRPEGVSSCADAAKELARIAASRLP